MAARIAPCCRVKAARELPYIYISICSENNNPWGGGGEVLAGWVRGGFGGTPLPEQSPQDPMEGFLPKQRNPAGFSHCRCPRDPPSRGCSSPGAGLERGSGGTETPNPPQKGWSAAGSSIASHIFPSLAPEQRDGRRVPEVALSWRALMTF